MAKFVGILRVS